MRKRFCKHGHDIEKVGRYTRGQCIACTKALPRNPEVAARSQRRHHQAIRRYLEELKLSLGCLLCGSRDDLQWHHWNPERKAGNLGSIRTWVSAKRELQRVDVLCRECHDRLHSKLPGEALGLSALWVPE